MNLRTYIYEDHNDLFEDVFDEIKDTTLGNEKINKSYENFYDFMNLDGVKEFAERIKAEDFSLEYLRRPLDEVEPENIVKYFYVHTCSSINPYEPDMVLFSQLSDKPDVRGNNLYLQDGSIKKLALKYDLRFKTYTDDLD